MLQTTSAPTRHEREEEEQTLAKGEPERLPTDRESNGCATAVHCPRKLHCALHLPTSLKADASTPEPSPSADPASSSERVDAVELVSPLEVACAAEERRLTEGEQRQRQKR